MLAASPKLLPVTGLPITLSVRGLLAEVFALLGRPTVALAGQVADANACVDPHFFTTATANPAGSGAWGVWLAALVTAANASEIRKNAAAGTKRIVDHSLLLSGFRMAITYLTQFAGRGSNDPA